MLKNIFIEINELQQYILEGNRKVAIYGAGKLALNLFEVLKQKNIKIECFIDYEMIPTNKIGSIINGISVQALNDAEKTIDTIIIASSFINEIVPRISKNLQVDVVIIDIKYNTTQNRYVVDTEDIDNSLMKEFLKLSVEPAIIEEIFNIVKPYTFGGKRQIYFTMLNILHAIQQEKKGVFAELGVYKGGNSLAALLIQKKIFNKVIIPVYMLDAFTYFPDPSPEDLLDSQIKESYTNDGVKISKHYPSKAENTCYVDDVKNLIASFGFKDGEYRILQGWFNDTLPGFIEEVKNKKISILRLDNDFYSSTKLCLEKTLPLVVADGLVIVDDYQYYAGCAMAVNEYIGINKLPYRICNLGDTAFFYKNSEPIFKFKDGHFLYY